MGMATFTGIPLTRNYLVDLMPRLHMQFLLAIAMQFQEIVSLPSHINISVFSMSCAGNATTSEKLIRKSVCSGNFSIGKFCKNIVYPGCNFSAQ